MATTTTSRRVGASSSSATSLLLPLKTARSVGLPITRSILEPVVLQIIAQKRWQDTLQLFHDEQELLSRNHDLCKLLLRSPAAAAAAFGSDVDSNDNNTSSSSSSPSAWLTSLEIFRRASECVTGQKTLSAPLIAEVAMMPSSSSTTTSSSKIMKHPRQQQQQQQQRSSTSSAALLLCEQLAQHGRWEELAVIRKSFMQMQMMEDKRRKNISTSVSESAVVTAAAATAAAGEELRRFELAALLHAGRWVGATAVFEEVVCSENKQQQQNRRSDSDMLQQRAASPSSSGETSRVPLAEASKLAGMLQYQGRWTEGCNLFNFVFREALRNKRQGLYAPSSSSASSSSSSSSRNSVMMLEMADLLGASISVVSTSPKWWLGLEALARVQRNLRELPITAKTIDAASAASSSSSSSASRRFRDHLQKRAMTQSSPTRAVSLALDFAYSQQWLHALRALQSLDVKTTSKYSAAKIAGAIMIAMSKINDWQSAFRVYSHVVEERKKFTHDDSLQESDQRALLFVCTHQRRWQEAFQLLMARPDTKVDRLGLAFHSRPPWQMALRFARALWPRAAGSEETRVSILSGCAASALVAGRGVDGGDGDADTNHHRHRIGRAGPLDVGVKIVRRMMEQKTPPKGDVVALLPLSEAIVTAKTGLVPLVEMLLAIRSSGGGGGATGLRGSRRNQWMRSLSLASAALEGCDKRLSEHIDNKKKQMRRMSTAAGETNEEESTEDTSADTASVIIDTILKKTKLCKAAAEALVHAATTTSSSYNNNNNNNSKQSSSSSSSGSGGSATVVVSPFWYEALKIAENLQVATTTTAEKTATTPLIEKISTSTTGSSSLSSRYIVKIPKSDDDNVILNDARATFASVLHITTLTPYQFHNSILTAPVSVDADDNNSNKRISDVGPLRAVMNMMKHRGIPLRFHTRDQSPFREFSILRHPKCVPETVEVLKLILANNNNNRKTKSGKEDDDDDDDDVHHDEEFMTMLLNPSPSSLSALPTSPLWPSAIRDAFFFCAFNNRGSPEIARLGLSFYALMLKADNALRSIDGKRLVFLYATLMKDANNNNNDNKTIPSGSSSSSSYCYWLAALQQLQMLQRRNLLDDDAVESYMTHFRDSQWETAARLFTARHRDAVFRGLLATGRLD